MSMKLIMESWRSYTEMRDRYLPPGEDPNDPTPEEEDRFEQNSQTADDIIYTAIENPGQLQTVDDSFHVVYDSGGDQFLTFTSDNPASLDDYDELFYREDEDKITSIIVSRIEAAQEAY